MGLIPASNIKKGDIIIYNKKTKQSNPNVPNSLVYSVKDNPRNVKAGKHGSAKNIFELIEYFGTGKVEMSLSRSQQLWKHRFETLQGKILDEIVQGRNNLLYILELTGSDMGTEFTIEKPKGWPKEVKGLDVSFVKYVQIGAGKVFRRLLKIS